MEKQTFSQRPSQGKEVSKDEEKRLSRQKRREQLEGLELAGEVRKVLKHYFPEFIQQLRSIPDPRHPSYITYPAEMLLLVRVIGAMIAVKSMRSMTETMNHTACMKAVGELLGNVDLQELPHWSTINNFLERVEPEDLERVIQAFVTRLIRMRAFEQNRYRKYWRVAIDGTQLYCFRERHCEHCLTRVHEKGTPQEWTQYYHYALEAKLILAPELVIHLAVEFVENPAANPTDSLLSKQDCELKAFFRLAAKLKTAFQRLPICLLLDSLYAARPVFELCQNYHWRFIIRFKDGRIPSVADEFQRLKQISPENMCSRSVSGYLEHFYFVCNISYGNISLNCAELILPDNKPGRFCFITNFSLNRYNVPALIAAGRSRWKIENLGFNAQKNHDYFLSHLFSLNPTAMKNHYLLIQIAHAFIQLLLLKLQNIIPACGSIRQFRAELRFAFCFLPLIQPGPLR